MGERVRYGLVSFAPADGWLRTTPGTFGALHPKVPDYVLRSPRSDGRFQIATVAMPADMGSFDLPRLRKLVERPSSTPLPPLSFFDEVTWQENGIAGLGRSSVSDPESPFAKPFVGKLRETEIFVKMREEERAEFERYLADPTVRRDWYLACGVEMANIWYRCPNGDAVAADLADCEEMVRSIRFVSAAIGS